MLRIDVPIATLGSADHVLISQAGNRATVRIPAKKLSPEYVVTPDELPSDVTAYLQAILNLFTGGTIKISPGMYDGIGRLIVPAGTVLELMAGSTLRARALTTAEANQQTADQVTWSVVWLMGGARLRGEGRIDGNRSVRGACYGVFIANTDERTKVSGVQITNMGNSGIFFIAAHRVHIKDADIWNCYGKGIEGVISRKARINSNHIEQCYHGIQWWGDDTNGWCTNWTITSNVVTDMGNQANGQEGGGIWGARGKAHTIQGNTLDEGYDVGIDLEITTDCSVIGNTVTNYKKAALSVFCASKRNTFSGNTVRQAAGYGSCFKVYGRVAAYPAESDPTNFDITLEGGSLYTESTADAIVTDGGGVIEGLTIHNVRIECTDPNSRPMRLLETNRATVTYNRTKAKAQDCILNEGGSDCVIAHNELRYTGTTPASARGILLFFRNGYPNKRNQVSKNRLYDYGAGIHDDCWGDNTSLNRIEDNTTPAVTTSASFASYVAIVNGNRDWNFNYVDRTATQNSLPNVADLTAAAALQVKTNILINVATDSDYGDTNAVYIKTPTTLERLSKTAK
jgi:parallel beta-helix repeat protein